MQSFVGFLGACVVSAACLAACAAAPAPGLDQAHYSQTGLASWYGRAFHHKLTASGERFDMHGLTAAHRSLPLDTVVRVTNIENGRAVMVRINDRGPYAGERIIDLSARAAQVLDMQEDGLAQVRLEVFESDQEERLAADAGAFLR